MEQQVRGLVDHPHRGPATSLAMWFAFSLLVAQVVATVLAFMEAWAIAAVVLGIAGALVGTRLAIGWKGCVTMATIFLLSQVLIFRLPHVIGAELPSDLQLAWDGRLAVIRMTVAWALSGLAGIAIVGHLIGWKASGRTIVAFAIGGALQGLLTETAVSLLGAPVAMAIGGYVLALAILAATQREDRSDA